MKKTIAVLGLAAVSNAIHNNYVDDEYFGLGVNIHSKVQTADVHGSRGQINVNMRDDADNELHNYYSMPHNKGDIQFNDYTVKKDDAADDEYFFGIKINNKVQTADVHGSHGMINVNMRDDADSELHNYYSMPHNNGNIQFNDYTKAKDDELFGLGVDIKSKVQTVNASGSRGKVNLNFQDDADSELFGLDVGIKSKVQTADVHGSRGKINVNMRDDADDEYFGLGVDVKSKVQTVNASGSRGKVNLNFRDDADSELHSYFTMPHNKGNIQFNDYTQAKDDEFFGLDVGIKSKVQTADVHGSRGKINVNMRDDADDEYFGLGVDVKSKVQTVNASGSRGKVNLNFRDDADSELHSYFTMPHNKGNIQFNDYSQAKDDEFFGLGVNIHSKVQTADVHGSRGQINVNMRDDADDEYFGLGVNIHSKVQTADVHGSRGQINVNMRDDADDEFYQAPSTSKVNKDEIEVLRLLLKHATQDKNGNLVFDGVKIGKIPRAQESKTKEAKPLKTDTPSKPHPSIPERKFLAL